MALGRQKRKKVEGEEKRGYKQAKIKTSLSRFIQLHGMPTMFVCDLSADTDRNFNYLIRERK